jgi:hypothetical protein
MPPQGFRGDYLVTEGMGKTGGIVNLAARGMLNLKNISFVSWQCIGIRLPGGIDGIDIVKAVAGIQPRGPL